MKFEDMINNIINCDCYEMIKNIPDKSIDLVIIDPPYEIINGVHSSGFLKNRKQLDSTKQIFQNKLNIGIDEKVLNELDKKMKKINIYIWCNKKQLLQYLEHYNNENIQIEVLIWNKYNCLPLTNNTYLPDKEFCLYFKQKGICLNTKYETAKTVYNIPINVNDKKNYNHPTIKPLEIIKNLVINSSNKNDIVLDCFCGSGTTCVAAKETGRRFIGMEINKEYYEIAKKRINGMTASGQMSMMFNDKGEVLNE